MRIDQHLLRVPPAGMHFSILLAPDMQAWVLRKENREKEGSRKFGEVHGCVPLAMHLQPGMTICHCLQVYRRANTGCTGPCELCEARQTLNLSALLPAHRVEMPGRRLRRFLQHLVTWSEVASGAGSHLDRPHPRAKILLLIVVLRGQPARNTRSGIVLQWRWQQTMALLS